MTLAPDEAKGKDLTSCLLKEQETLSHFPERTQLQADFSHSAVGARRVRVRPDLLSDKTSAPNRSLKSESMFSTEMTLTASLSLGTPGACAPLSNADRTLMASHSHQRPLSFPSPMLLFFPSSHRDCQHPASVGTWKGIELVACRHWPWNASYYHSDAVINRRGRRADTLYHCANIMEKQ